MTVCSISPRCPKPRLCGLATYCIDLRIYNELAPAMQSAWLNGEPAQGIEAATAGETEGLDTKCESPVGSADAPNPADPTIPNNPTSSMGERP